jgi:glycosyltransferase involved in cell wall biosynthesis
VTFSVIVPTCRRPAVLRTTLEALVAVEFPEDAFEVVVVDDNGDRETAEVVAAFQQGPVSVRYLCQPGLGAAAARNGGARVARGEVLLFCDDDMRVDPQHLRQHLATRAACGDVLVGGVRWYSPSSLAALETTPFGRYRVQLEHGFDSDRKEQHPIHGPYIEMATLPSFDLSIARETFWKLGGFDETFPYAGAEDQDLSTRAIRAGLRLIRNREISLLHDDLTTTLRLFGEREERGAHTVVALTRKFPEFLGEFYKNAPISRKDPPSLLATKVAKAVFSRAMPLNALHFVATVLERAGTGDRRLWKLYRIIIGLHIFRGYRAALRAAAASPSPS